jgi:hypothetical protein
MKVIILQQAFKELSDAIEYYEEQQNESFASTPNQNLDKIQI